MNTNDFVESCSIKYRLEPGPSEEKIEYAHHPTPKCLGGIETVPLWKSDHAVHNVLQSQEFDHPCVYGWERQYLVEEWEWLLPVFDHYLRQRGVIGGTKSRASYEQYSSAGRKRGLLIGASNRDLKRGFCDPLVQSKAGKIGSGVTNSQRWEDPDHPELGQHSAGTLVRMQMRRNLPHTKLNRRRVK